MMEYNVQIAPFKPVYSISNLNGYIVWRRGTGDNVELLHLRTYEPGKGTGRYLVRRMLYALLTDPPYATVFGFTRGSNTRAQTFYLDLGFDLSPVKGVYAEGSAVIFSQLFKTLLELHNVRY